MFPRRTPPRWRVSKAGAIVVGKTNMPEFAGDLQSYSEIAGTATNRGIPGERQGGSTGGGAALHRGRNGLSGTRQRHRRFYSHPSHFWASTATNPP
jgi:hypothetical protein